MKICFVAHKITNPVTGGEFYNEAIMHSAELAGFRVEKWEGTCLDRIKSVLIKIVLINMLYLYKTLFLSKKDIIVFDTDFHARYLIALLWARYIKRLKTVGLVHHYSFLIDKGHTINYFHYHLEKFITNKFNHMIINSQFSFRTFSKLINKPISYTIIHPFSKPSKNISIKKAQFNPDKISLLQIGTIDERKNVLNTIKATTSLKINYTLNFVGHCYSNKYLSKINDFIDQNQLHSKVFLHGRVDNNRLQYFYENSSIFILVSKLEGYGMVYAEAMQYGLPIVGSTMGAVPELVEHEQNGYLCDPDEPEQITEAILKITDNKNWHRIHKNNIQKASSLMDRESFIRCGKELFEKLKTNSI